jgi:hypothetical protein
MKESLDTTNLSGEREHTFWPGCAASGCDNSGPSCSADSCPEKKDGRKVTCKEKESPAKHGAT